MKSWWCEKLKINKVDMRDGEKTNKVGWARPHTPFSSKITLLIFLLIFSPTFAQLACSSCEEPKLPLPGKFQDAANWRALAPTTSRHKWMMSWSNGWGKPCLCQLIQQEILHLCPNTTVKGWNSSLWSLRRSSHVAESWFPISQNDYSNHKTNDLKKTPEQNSCTIGDSKLRFRWVILWL